MSTAASLGDVLEIDDRTVLVLGQELDVAHDQPDVANALVHRAGDTLVIVDTGVTTHSAPRCWRADRGRPVVPAAGADHPRPPRPRRQQRPGRRAARRRAGGALRPRPGPRADARPGVVLDSVVHPDRGRRPVARAARLAGNKVVSLFQPLRPFASVTRTYEERPLERIRIGSTRFTGWTFVDGAVRVLRSQGHCAGHVVVHLRDSGILHLSDEANGPCGAMADADQLKIQTTIGASRPTCSRRARPPSSPTATPSPSAAVTRRCPTWTGCWTKPPPCRRPRWGSRRRTRRSGRRLHRPLLRRPHRARRRGRQPQPVLHRDGGDEPAPPRSACGPRPAVWMRRGRGPRSPIRRRCRACPVASP